MRNKNESRQITVAEMAPHVHSFRIGENKVEKISNWLAEWIKKSLKSGKIKPNDFLPSKGMLAFHIGVSQGTMQNVFRFVEDMGLIESKQKIGTYIKVPGENIDKLTSKREKACESVKRYIVENNLKSGDILISIRKLSSITGISNATLRIAFNTLVNDRILSKNKNEFVVLNTDFVINNINECTLVKKIAKRIESYIKKNLHPGDKLPSNNELAASMRVSIKTIHDSVKLLAKEGVVKSRRGCYGTIVLYQEIKHDTYLYEKAASKIKNYIFDNCQIGSKIPSIRAFAELYKISSKTVKKALDDLAEDGYVTFVRGRYGGTFVTDIPQNSENAYEWLALSSDYTNIEKN